MNNLQKAIKSISNQLIDRIKDIEKIDDRDMNFFLNKIGRRKEIQRADSNLLEKVRKAGGLLTVDTSYHRFGGSAPHYIEIYQSIGLSTTKPDKMIENIIATTPLEEGEVDFSFDDKRSKESEIQLARAELETAIELVEKQEGFALILDGSLIRFKILDEKLWEKLLDICESKNLPIIGLIEEIKTNHIGKGLNEKGLSSYIHFDREILSGRLNRGEILIPNEEYSEKSEAELSTLFGRFSTEPFVIGMDMAGKNDEKMLELAKIIYAITPKRGRSIPMILDIVDKKARLEKERTVAVIKSSLNTDLLELYFKETRSRRRF